MNWEGLFYFLSIILRRDEICDSDQIAKWGNCGKNIEYRSVKWAVSRNWSAVVIDV